MLRAAVVMALGLGALAIGPVIPTGSSAGPLASAARADALRPVDPVVVDPIVVKPVVRVEPVVRVDPVIVEPVVRVVDPIRVDPIVVDPIRVDPFRPIYPRGRRWYPLGRRWVR
jgi:hypothetical protein